MKEVITLTREQVAEINRATNGIGELLKKLPSKPEHFGVIYAIISNLTLIQTNLAGMPRVNSN